MFLSLEFTVDICEQENKMALYFSYENQIYLPKVDGGTLRVNINICTVHTLPRGHALSLHLCPQLISATYNK